jgi:hypothetical protein
MAKARASHPLRATVYSQGSALVNRQHTKGFSRVCRVALRALPLHEPTGDHHSTVQAVGDAARILRPPVLLAFTAEQLGVGGLLRCAASDSSVACSDAGRCSAKSYQPRNLRMPSKNGGGRLLFRFALSRIK